MYTENDNINREAIEEYKRMTPEQLDELLAAKEKEVKELLK